MLSYLAIQGTQAGPLFITKQERGLTHQMFSSESALSGYSTNSNKAGVQELQHPASSATQAIISDSQIKMLGRWQSNAYQCYL